MAGEGIEPPAPDAKPDELPLLHPAIKDPAVCANEQQGA